MKCQRIKANENAQALAFRLRIGGEKKGRRGRRPKQKQDRKKGEQRSENDDKTKLHLMREKYYLLFPIINLEHRAVRLTLCTALALALAFALFAHNFYVGFLFNKRKNASSNVSAIF
jgi:hypothetical protein